jgi:hypothetical protein
MPQMEAQVRVVTRCYRRGRRPARVRRSGWSSAFRSLSD